RGPQALRSSVDSRARVSLSLAAVVILTVFALRPAQPYASTSASSTSSDAPPNVLLITIDTVRADHIGAYGATKAATPAIDRLAREGVRFADATTQAPLTGPAHAAILTGRYPARFGQQSNPQSAIRNPPWFAWVHLYDAHAPYDPPAPFRTRFQTSPYDGEIAYVDSCVARLVATLERAGQLDRTLVVVIADHGE